MNPNLTLTDYHDLKFVLTQAFDHPDDHMIMNKYAAPNTPPALSCKAIGGRANLKVDSSVSEIHHSVFVLFGTIQSDQPVQITADIIVLAGTATGPISFVASKAIFFVGKAMTDFQKGSIRPTHKLFPVPILKRVEPSVRELEIRINVEFCGMRWSFLPYHKVQTLTTGEEWETNLLNLNAYLIKKMAEIIR